MNKMRVSSLFAVYVSELVKLWKAANVGPQAYDQRLRCFYFIYRNIAKCKANDLLCYIHYSLIISTDRKCSHQYADPNFP